MPDKFVGRKLGPYTLEFLLGKGGMGTVYRATDEAGNAVAVKILPVDEDSATSTMAARFKREIDACKDTKSVHVIKLFEAGIETDCHWYSMEVLEGDTLQQLSKKRGRMPHEEVARICREVALALEHIHARGIIHRDLKPGNIMIVRSGRTVLMDFGLAKVADRTRITKTGHGLGTPRYMAPEMLLAKKPTPATDIYQLGVILYELLTGQTVVKAKSFATLAHELTRVYPPPLLQLDPSLSPSLNTLVFNCIEKDQKRRYQSAADFRADLDRAFAGEPIEKLGDGKILKLGESSGEHSTDEFTAELPASAPRGKPLPPDSRGSGRNARVTTGGQAAVRPSASRPRISSSQGRVSSSFSSVAPAVDEGMPAWISDLLAQHKKWLGPALGLVGATFLFWLLVGGAWNGDTSLEEDPVARVSPSGAEIRFRTKAQIPGEVRLFRYLDAEGGGEAQLDSKTRIYRATDTTPGRVHLVTIERLVPGRAYAAEVHFPDGSSRHRVRFQIPERAAIQDLRVERGRDGGAEVHFRMPFAVDGHMRQGPPGSGGALPLPGGPAEAWEIPLPMEDPFQEVSGVYLDLEGAAGWKQTFGPYDFQGLDGEVRAALEALDVHGILAELEDARRDGASITTLAALQDKLRQHRIGVLLDRIRDRVGGFFESDVDFERKLGLFHALQRVAPIDFYSVARNLPALLNVERFTKGFLPITEKPHFETLPGVVAGNQVAIELVRPGDRKVCLLPAGVDARAYQRSLHTQVLGVDLGASAKAQVTFKPKLPTPLPEEITLVVQMGNFHPDYYLEVEINGRLTLLMNTPNPSAVLGAGEGGGVGQAVVRRSAQLPTAELQPGENRIKLSLHGFGPVSGGPAWVHQLDVYYLRGGR